jgi:hypothetical protein
MHQAHDKSSQRIERRRALVPAGNAATARTNFLI